MAEEDKVAPCFIKDDIYNMSADELALKYTAWPLDQNNDTFRLGFTPHSSPNPHP